MKRAKYNEVPKSYRRNYKKELIDFLLMLAMCAGTIAIMIVLFVITN